MNKFKGLPLNFMLAEEAEEFYGQLMTEEHIALIEQVLNRKINELKITGLYIKVEKYDKNTFSVTPIIGSYKDSINNEKHVEEIEDNLNEWGWM